MPQSSENYPALADLISGWFHQDFDIEGDTIEEIIGAFHASSTLEARQAVIAEITHFLHQHAAAIDGEFMRIFQPDVNPAGFAHDTRAFLQEIALHLAK
jgi:CdiI immunity protein